VTPDASTVFEVVVEAEDVASAEASFRRILQARGRRFQTMMNDLPIVGRRNAFRLLQVLCPLVWFLGLAITGMKIHADEPFDEVLPWGLLTLAFGAISAALLIVGFDLAEAFFDRLTDRLWARAARKVIEKTLPLAPFRVTYTIDGDEWRTVVERPRTERRFRREDVHDVVCDGQVCLVFRRKYAQRYKAVVWAKTPEIRAAIQDFAD
jgi:hypothetical protein